MDIEKTLKVVSLSVLGLGLSILGGVYISLQVGGSSFLGLLVGTAVGGGVVAAVTVRYDRHTSSLLVASPFLILSVYGLLVVYPWPGSSLEEKREPSRSEMLEAQKRLEAFSRPAYGMAVIETGREINHSHELVTEFDRLLTETSAIFPESRRQIGSMSTHAHQVLSKKRHSASVLKILKGMSTICGGRVQRKYSEFLAVYLSYRERGVEHAGSMEKLANMANSEIEVCR